MKLWEYVTCIVVGAACVALSIATVLTAQSNAKLQGAIQLRQQQLNSGIMGPQGQQVAGNILQDMAAAAGKNPKMRGILTKHGYTVPSAPAASAEEERPDSTITTTPPQDAVQE